MDPFEPTPQQPYTPSSRPSRIAEKMGTARNPEPERKPSPERQRRHSASDSSRKRLVTTTIIIAAAIVVTGAIIAFMLFKNSQDEAQQKIEQLELANQQLALQNEYAALDTEFQGYENQTRAITDDSVKRALQEKYNAAKLRVEELLHELNSEKAKSAQQIQQLKDEIATLKGILRHYVEEIDRLSRENEALRNENSQVKEENQRLSSQVSETSRQNEQLSERMSLAEKLNVTGVNLTALNSKGKNEKKVKKAKQLCVSFTIPQNNSTPVGEKTIYLRITSPAGMLLGNAGTFPFEGGSVEYTARKAIEYAGEEISGINIYWDVNTAIEAGEYTVELFADNYRLTSRKFTLK